MLAMAVFNGKELCTQLAYSCSFYSCQVAPCCPNSCIVCTCISPRDTENATNVPMTISPGMKTLCFAW